MNEWVRRHGLGVVLVVGLALVAVYFANHDPAALTAGVVLLVVAAGSGELRSLAAGIFRLEWWEKTRQQLTTELASQSGTGTSAEVTVTPQRPDPNAIADALGKDPPRSTGELARRIAAVVGTMSTPVVFPGGSAQAAGNITVALTARIDTDGAVVSFEIETPGVTFALAPDVLHPIASTNIHLVAVARWLADRSTDTRVVLEVLGQTDAALLHLTISNIHYNVAPTVLSGTQVSLRVEWAGKNARQVAPHVTNAVVLSRSI
ncbi:MAG: hypothetical protein IVW53_14105 [Chloroflexi bacterium]|nr:hypothetical protein [Chloroflexota bacterium]